MGCGVAHWLARISAVRKSLVRICAGILGELFAQLRTLVHSECGHWTPHKINLKKEGFASNCSRTDDSRYSGVSLIRGMAEEGNPGGKVRSLMDLHEKFLPVGWKSSILLVTIVMIVNR